MNDLIRPSLYQAWQAISPVDTPHSRAIRRATTWSARSARPATSWARIATLALAAGDLLAVRSAGAYGFVMASNYNTRPRPQR